MFSSGLICLEPFVLIINLARKITQMLSTIIWDLLIDLVYLGVIETVNNLHQSYHSIN